MKKWNKKIIIPAIVLSVFAIIILLAGIHSVKKEEGIHIIYIPKTIDETNDFWCALIAGAEMAAKENNVALEINGPENELDYRVQNKMIREALKKKPDAIVVSPASYSESVEVLKEIKEKGIKLVLIDSAVSVPVQDSIVATDNFQAGMKMAEPMQDLIQEDSVIAIVSHVKNASTAIEREKGLRAGLGEHENKITDILYCNSDYEKAYELTKHLLESKKIDFLACLNEYSAVGAARAIIDLGMSEEICVVGFDNSIEEMKLLEEGVFAAVVVQKAFNMGYLGIETAVKDVKGEKIEKSVDSGSKLITKENMYREENQELLFPFYGK